MSFENHKTKGANKSSVWYYFLTDTTGISRAKCKICNKILKTNGGSTKGLLTHLGIHSIKLQKDITDEPQAKILKITNFTVLQEDSLGASIARMTAVDGFPFSVFITSSELRKSLISRGFDVPKSKETIKARFMDYYLKCKNKMKDEKIGIKGNNLKFSLTFDEWTSTSNKRFINIILRSSDNYFNLGLVRLKKSATAVVCIQYLEQRLSDFGVSLSNDIVGFTTDGASTMKKIGKIIAPKQQLCIAHGLHLALVDILYKSNDFPCESSSDEDEEFDSFTILKGDIKSDLTEKFNIKTLIEKVRKISKIFRKSPTKNEILQKYVKEMKGKELKLMLDCQTRWNTLFDMCQRFMELEIPIKKALIDLKSHQICDEEFQLLKQIVLILNPVKVTVEALCRRDMNLCKADAALSFMLNEISKIDCKLSDELIKSLLKRIKERRTIYSTLLNFLKNPKLNSEFDNSTDLFVIKNELKKLIGNFRTDEQSNNSSTNDSDSDLSFMDEANEDPNISIVKKLNSALEKCKSPTKNPNVLNDIDSNIEKEVDLFVSGGDRGITSSRISWGNLTAINELPYYQYTIEEQFFGLTVVTAIQQLVS
ncbi:hypothetical protein CVS40_0250 [Lucilia cuprina]|nr:hypothetical protein CVS40_0250 [Lucilia cuprina]